MIERAIEKLKAEMDKNNNPYIKAIGDFLLKQVEINRDAAEKIASGDKTIESSLKEVEKIAKTKAVRGCAVMSDAEVFDIVKKFYNFEAVQDKFIQVEVQEIHEQVHEEVKVEAKEKKIESKVIAVDFSTSLDDYL